MKREKLQQLAHLIAGILTLIYGFDAFEAGDFLYAACYLTLAILFLIVTGTHKWIARKLMKADAAFNLLEAVTIIYSAWHYKNKGHQILFYIMAIAGLAYLIFALLNLLTEAPTKHRSSRKKKRRRSSPLFKEQKPDGQD
jgi:cellulose synthase/poly-beta-1,6-N-acetylglucosamine synthase-like glycosyltransferase